MNWKHDKPPALIQDDIRPHIYKLADVEPYTFHTTLNGKTAKITLFPNTSWITNLGSIPRLFWPLFPPHEYTEAYFIHDILYSLQVGTRKEADADLFKRIDQHDRNTRAYIIWLAVRLFGGDYWDKETRSAEHKKKLIKIDYL